MARSSGKSGNGKSRQSTGRAEQRQEREMGTGTRLAIAGVLGLGALASGFLLSRSGRRLVSDTFRGRRRTPLTDRVLEALLADPAVGRRRIEVEEAGEGEVRLTGAVATDRERSIARELALGVGGVEDVDDRLVLDPSLRRRRAAPSGKRFAR